MADILEPRQLLLVDFHEDILEGVFHRLPLKSMVVFKIVCKKWNSIISNPQFLQETINRRLGGNHQFIFFNRNSIKLSIYSFGNHNNNLIHENQSNSITFSTFNNGTRFDPCNLSHFDMFLGTCNGLVALLLNKSCILCNPLTGEYKSYYLLTDPIRCVARYKKAQVGLCYDASNDECLLVMVVRVQKGSVVNLVGWFLSFNQNLLWYVHRSKRCKIELRNKSYFVEGIGKVFCGNAHWICQEMNNAGMIIYFDAKKREFNHMNLLDFNIDDRIMGFAAVDGEHQLGVVVGNTNSTWVKVWVMKEYGNQESWTSILRIKINVPNLNKSLNVLRLDVSGYKSTREILIATTTIERGLWVYDLQQQDLRKVETTNSEINFSITYKPSLILASFIRKLRLIPR